MDIELLRTFVFVARSGGFRVAAEKHFLTPSAISSRIKQLEDELGITLFERGKFGTRLTTHGKRLLNQAEDMLASWNRLRRSASVPEQSGQVLAIGATDTIWQAGLLQKLSHLRQQQPSLSIRMSNASADRLTQSLVDGELDIICLFDVPKQAMLQAHFMGSINLQLISSKSLQHVDDIAEDFIAVDWGQAGESILSYPGVRGAVTMHATTAWLGLNWLLSNGGCALLPDFTTAPHIAAGRLFPVAGSPHIQRQMYLIHRLHHDEQHAPFIEGLLQDTAAQ